MSSYLTKAGGGLLGGHFRRSSVWACAAALALGACSPTFNWREVRAPEWSLSLMLPCKPDRGSRSVPLGAQSVEMAMLGCEAGDALLALSHMPLPAGQTPGEALAHWRQATLRHLGAEAVGGPAQAFVPAGALGLPESLRQVVSGRQPDGRAVQAQLAWFAHAGADGTRLFQAAFYAPKVPAEPAQTWLDSLKFQ
ncbi:hypothetical protein PSQ40_19250 [Curvibacter sp. HBC61]|uniref:Lipoprotein n=1 Tax=Curvibacter cyanobacteriorum TaxID=3026422 RepID=A0ABT5N327_9BURK|nr:hypothetical protein [Curvibacter sp. HBC61]MDD0840721.1 hypothetical protein [Curvibacter sp. HBC61]